MESVELLKLQAELAYADLLESLNGVTEAQAWASLPQGGPDYLHTDASIYGIALHIAICKRMYGSVAFRGTEIRWRDTAEQLDRFETSWSAALAYLEESHRYWMGTWDSLTEADLVTDVTHFSGKAWPAWKIIRMMIHHDSYHCGQIAVLRYACPESTTPPASVAADTRNCCQALPSW